MKSYIKNMTRPL